MQCDPTTFSISDVRTLILLLASPDAPTCVVAIEALTKLAESASKNRIQLLNLGVMKPLLNLTASKEVAIKKAAAACIAASTELNELHPEMKKREFIEAIIKLLGPSEIPEVQDEAAFTLANLSKDFANKSEIRKARGIQALIRLLESTDPDVKKNAAFAISILLEDFSNRSEIRRLNGLAPLLELLGAEFREIQENALMSLIHAAGDFANRIDIRRLNGVRRMVDMLVQDTPELHHLTLMCLSNCLEDAETVAIFPEVGGIGPVVKMLGSEDVKVKKNASLVVARAAKNERNQSYFRDAGALAAVAANLSNSDLEVISHAAIAIAALAKNELNQIDMLKNGVVETIVKLLSHEDVDICRQSALAVSSMCLNAKIRSRVRALEAIPGIIKFLGLEDQQTLTNAAECIANLAEDSAVRSDIVRLNGVVALLANLGKSDPAVQSATCLALARCMQDAEARVIINKDKKFDGIGKLIALLASNDPTVTRNASFALSGAAQYELNSINACQMGAVDALLQLGKDPTKNSKKFGLDALDKLLNYNLPAKYWLKGNLSAENIIKDGFYDIGSAGNNFEQIKKLLPLEELTALPVDKRREILSINKEVDSRFQHICAAAASNLSGKSPRQQLRQIAVVVSHGLGGPIDPLKFAEFGYKFKVTELKLKLNSNVLPIGMLTGGIFYHRALLFKAVCDSIGLGPVTLQRGEYNRAWNIVDIRKQAYNPPQQDQPATSTQASTPSTNPANPPTAQQQKDAAASNTGAKTLGAQNAAAAKRAQSAKPQSREAASVLAATPQTNALFPTEATTQAKDVALAAIISSMFPPNWEAPSEPEDLPDTETLIDLVFEPGKLLCVSTPEADSYQRG